MTWSALRLLAAGAIIALLPAPAGAQLYTGRIDITVLDASGAVVPGATVELSGPQAEISITDEMGGAHFLNLPVGVYAIHTILQGFTEFRKTDIYVGAGITVPLRVDLQVAALIANVDVVTRRSPLELRRQVVGENVSVDQLQNLPTARDPWVILQTIPGVVTDRVNIGGSESGQQSLYNAKGADFVENTWNVDGIPITDMTGLGGSPTYFDFDTFQELQITTGGADAQVPTPGVQLNVVLKQGTNKARGLARLFFTDQSLQSSNLPADLVAVAGPSGKGNRMDRYSDYGFEFGGPVQANRWWAWGALSRTDVRILTLNDVPDRTILKDAAFKLTGLLNTSSRVGFTYLRGEKQKNGRGAGPFNPAETTQDQQAPTTMYKGEISTVVGRSVFLTGRAAYETNNFTLDPKGGRDTQVFQDANGVYHGSFYYFETRRPQAVALLDGNWFRGRHEVKFGGSWRRVKESDDFGWGGGALNIQLDPASNELLTVLYRPWSERAEAHYVGAYVGDTITADRLTAHLALRFDRTTNSVLDTPVLPNPLAPDLLPGFSAPAIPDAIVWNNVSPRIGATYALDGERRNVVRASYAAFASQLSVQKAAVASAATYAYAYYLAVDANGNHSIEPSEILRNAGAQGAVGVDLSNPTSTTSVNRIQPDLRSPRTHEVVVGFDRSLFRDIVFTTTYTWRRITSVLWEPFVGVRQNDYVLAGHVTGSTSQTGAYDTPYYVLPPGAAPPGGGIELVNRDGYHRSFSGLEATVIKRLSNRWMGRVSFSFNDEREYFDNPDTAIGDPTPTPANPLRDGGVVVRDTSGIGKASFYMVSPRYQLVANGMWQGPWGVNLAGTLLTREGFATPYFVPTKTKDPLLPVKNVLVASDLNDARLSPLTTLDMRIEKALRLGGHQLLFDADVFNLANVSTPLRRQYNLHATGTKGFDNVLEIVSPRIVRVGVRLDF